MIVLKYFITLILSFFSASFIVIILTNLRCYIPVCKNAIKDTEVPQDEKQASKKLIKKYSISIIINFSLFVIISLLIYFLLKETLIFYIVFISLYTLIYYKYTGITQDNLMRVNHAINCNKGDVSSNENS